MLFFPDILNSRESGKSREIVTISREFLGKFFVQIDLKYHREFNIFNICLSTFNVMGIIYLLKPLITWFLTHILPMFQRKKIFV